MVVTIPAAQVAAGQLPHVCARHGEQPIEMKNIRLISKPPPWAPLLILAGGIVYVIVVSAMRKKVQAPAWPLCAQCKAQRSRNLGIGLGVVGLGVLLFVIGAAVGSDNGSILLLLGFFALLAGLVVAARSNYQVISSAFVSQDGNFVEVTKADERFAQALRQVGAAPQPQQQMWGYGAAPQYQQQQVGYPQQQIAYPQQQQAYPQQQAAYPQQQQAYPQQQQQAAYPQQQAAYPQQQQYPQQQYPPQPQPQQYRY